MTERENDRTLLGKASLSLWATPVVILSKAKDLYCLSPENAEWIETDCYQDIGIFYQKAV